MQKHMGESIMKEMLNLVIKEHFLDNYKPSWLNGLELDRYYPSLRSAFEFQGGQHTEYSFSLYDNHLQFLKQVENDKAKKKILEKKKIKLFEIDLFDLSPVQFYQKIATLTFSNQIPDVPKKLLSRIQRYQTGVPIFIRKERQDFLEKQNVHKFLKVPYVHQVVHRFSPLPSHLDADEKFTFVLLCALSRGDEVQLTLNQIEETIPGVINRQHVFTLMEKKFLIVHPRYFLIKLKQDEVAKNLDFIKKTIIFLERKGIELE